MASGHDVMAAAEALSDREIADLVGSLTEDARRALAGALRITPGAFRKARSPRALLLRSLRRLPPATRAEVAQMLTVRCLDDAVEALGDDADDPSRERLEEVLGPLVETHGVGATRLMLAATAELPSAKARVVCAEVLADDPRFALPVREEPASDASGAAAVGAARAEEAAAAEPADAGESPEEQEAKRAERRRRKEEKRRKVRDQRNAVAQARAAQREARKARRPSPAPRPVVDDAPPAPARPQGVTSTVAPPPERRPVRLVGRYEGLIADDPAIGDVVLVPVPFADEEDVAKTRPAVVVGATRYQLVVRPCYSEGGVAAGDWRSVEVTDLRAAGLDAASFVGDEEVVVPRSEVHEKLGRLAPQDWNQL